MVAERYLIVNADDFGQSPGVNRGVIEAREHGIVTSASLMVRWPAAAEAASYGRQQPNFSLGLHVDLGEWAYRNGRWIPIYEVVPIDDLQGAKDEVSRQLAAFRTLVGRDPTHIDSHQHAHLREPVRSVLIELSRQLEIPLRHFCSEVRYCGDFYGQTAEGSPLANSISVDRLIKFLAAISPGITELGCHPGLGDDLETMYSNERAQEVKVLCDEKVRTSIGTERIELRSFGNDAAPPLRVCP
jgi:predicted glycoside hydrolase/deacetylase ChbG (UPF0249 family)